MRATLRLFLVSIIRSIPKLLLSSRRSSQISGGLIPKAASPLMNSIRLLPLAALFVNSSPPAATSTALSATFCFQTRTRHKYLVVPILLARARLPFRPDLDHLLRGHVSRQQYSFSRAVD